MGQNKKLNNKRNAKRGTINEQNYKDAIELAWTAAQNGTEQSTKQEI